jgi:hypothetical protein
MTSTAAAVLDALTLQEKERLRGRSLSQCDAYGQPAYCVDCLEDLPLIGASAHRCVITPAAPAVRVIRCVNSAGQPGHARTADGEWGFDRSEETGGWEVFWLPGVRARTELMPVGLLPTIDGCEAFVATGLAWAELDRLQAHGRGEHAAARDSRCGRC